ncbi:MAG: DsbA family protein [Halobacteriaceae archaeon]
MDHESSVQRHRRGYLAAVATTLSGLAGCGSSGGGDTGPQTTPGRTTTDTETTTATEEFDFPTDGADGNGSGSDTNVDLGEKTTTERTEVAGALSEHPAGAGIQSQPLRGSLSAPATIVAFEDPSCPQCRAFEEDVVPKIRSNLVEPGKASLVFRGYPVVYPWGEPAVHALEAAFDRSAAAHFALAEHYFAEQDAFTTDNVVARTRQFLETNTSIDAEAVVTAAAERRQTTAVQTDLDAGMAAGASQITPHLFLFDEGEYLTKASGSVSYDLIAAALDV